MDRASLGEGGVVRMWMPDLGGEVTYSADLPSCCERDARSADDAFECVSCGAMWRAVETPEAEEGCAFIVAEERDHRGAA